MKPSSRTSHSDWATEPPTINDANKEVKAFLEEGTRVGFIESKGT
jgi:hypothetical protein